MSTSVLTAPPVGERERKSTPVRAKRRVESIDLLRGVAIVFMVLDHVRDYFSEAQFSPSDLDRASPALFFTRWVTHFCAPVFVALAGTSVYLSARRGKTPPELARFLFTRGVWLIVLELTVLRFGMCFSFDYHWVSLTILWAIGWSMLGLSALIALRLPLVAVGAIGVAIVAGHNLLDGITFDHPRWLAILWTALHGPPDTFHFRARHVLDAHIMYPVLPWIGVIACGYSFGAILEMARERRRRLMVDLGVAMVVAFVALRAINVYGDPDPWRHMPTPLYTFLSFLNVSKYPPSLQFLLVTLGPALVLLAMLDREKEPDGPVSRVLLTFGRVPMFFFLVHWSLVHALAVVVALFRGEPTAWMFQVPPFECPDNYGYSLPVVYLLWGVVVVALYPACRWFADLKRRRTDWWWLSYF